MLLQLFDKGCLASKFYMIIKPSGTMLKEKKIEEMILKFQQSHSYVIRPEIL